MMKKLLFSVLLLLMMSIGAVAQEILTVCDGTATNSYVPFNGLYADYGTRSQFVLPAEDLSDMEGGSISQLTFYCSQSSLSFDQEVTVYMKEVDYTTFASATLEDWDGMTAVYTSTIGVSSNQMEITLSTPYTYSGGNLMIGLQVTAWGSSCPSSSWYGVNQSSGNYTAVYNNASSSHVWSSTISRQNFLPKTTFTYTPGAAPTCPRPTELAYSEVVARGAHLSWTNGGSESSWQICLNGDEENLITATTNPFDLTNLTPETAYAVKVRAVCAENDNSNWSNTVNFTTLPACPVPTALVFSNITNNYVSMSWTPGASETHWNLQYKKSSEEDWSDVIEVTTNPITNISGLDAGTTYNVRVQADCESEGTSTTWLTGSFSTAYGIPFLEEFGTSMPANWAQYTGLLSSVMEGTALTPNSYVWSFGTNNGVFDYHARVNIYGSNQRWLTTPTIVMDANVQLTFDLALTAYSGTGAASGNCDDDKFVVLISTDNGETWTILRQYDNAGSEDVYNDIPTAGVEVTIDLSSYATDNVIIAFYGESTVSGGDNNLHIDNVSLDYRRSCTKPTALTVSNVLARTADLAWTAGADETAWQICLNDVEADEALINVNEPSYTLTDLTPETPYTVKVRANCDGDVSAWTANSSFTTAVSCPAPTALTCTGITATTATLSWTAGASEGEWNLRYKAAADADWSVENDVTSPYTITGLTAETDYEVQVQAVCGVDDLSAWTSAHVYTGYCQPAPTSRDGKGITGVSFGSGDDIVNNSNSTGLPATSPYYGDYANLVGAVQAGVEATVNITYYTDGGYGYSYGYGTIIWIDLNNNLIFDGDEVVYVGESDDESPTTLAATFTLPASTPTGDYRMRIAAADSYYDSFTSSIDAAATANPCPTGSYTVVHDYTLRVLETPSCVPPTALSASNISNESATLTWTAGADETAWQICINNNEDELINVTETPYTMNLTPATAYSVKVRANCGDEDGVSDWSSAIQFASEICAAEDKCEISYVLSDPEYYGYGWYGAAIRVVDIESNIVLATWKLESGETSATGTLPVCKDRDIAFIWVAGQYDSYVTAYEVYDVNGDEIFSGAGAMVSPVNYTVNCSNCKKPSALEANNVTTSSAELTWTAGNAETAWQICVNGDEENLINVTETTYTLANLDEETDYTVKVRANCGEDQSGWIEESFTTLSSCPDPVDMVVTATTNTTANISWDGTVDSYVVRYAPGTIVLSEDFENGMPEGWTTIDVDGDGDVWANAGMAGHESEGCITSKSYDNNYGALTPDNWLITPAIELPSDASAIDLQFYANGQDASYANEHYGVYVSTTTTDPSAFTMLWAETMDAEGGPHRVQGVWGEKNTDLTAYAGQTVYIALRHFNTSDQFYLNVDDFVVYAVMPEDWEEATTTETSIELTNLNANTTYLYMMNGVCDGAANSTWTPVHTFTTEPNTYTITATAGDNGTILPVDETVVVEGEDLEITIEAATGYRIESVVVDGGTEAETDVTAQLTDGVYTFVNVTADHTIHATFVAVPEGEFVVTVNATENGTITPNGIQTVAENGDFTFTVTPAPCYGVAEVTVNGVEVTLDENNQYTASVTEDLTINAVFEMLTYTITATAGDHGTISPDNAVVNCGGEQVFTITPATGYRIATVVVDAETEGEANVTENVVAGDGYYTFTNVTANHTIHATFELIPTYTITVNAGENGNVYYNDALVSAPIVVTEGATPEFEITPATGYQIDVLSVGGNTIELTEQQLGGFTYTFEPVMADITLTVTFEAIPANTHTITLTVGEHGTVTASDEDDNEIAIENGVITVNDGEDVYLEFTPEENYRIDEIIVNGVSLELEEEDLEGFIYPMLDVTGDYTVSVTFTRLNAADMLEAGSMSIYPNPNNGMFSIDFSNIEGDATYQIIDARGAVVETRDINVMNGETMSFNHDLRPGTYFVRIINGDKVYVEQIVVE